MLRTDARGYARLVTTPAIQRVSMVPKPWKEVKEHAPDLIVLDAMLPEVHGFEIARRIKGSQRYGQLPIIMVSAVYRGWRYAEDLKQSFSVDHYIEKPFRISEILNAVDDCLHKRDGRPRPERRRGTSGAAWSPAPAKL